MINGHMRRYLTLQPIQIRSEHHRRYPIVCVPRPVNGQQPRAWLSVAARLERLVRRREESGELPIEWCEAFLAVPRHLFIPDVMWWSAPHGSRRLVRSRRCREESAGVEMGVECCNGVGVLPGLHQRSGGVELPGQSWVKVNLVGDVAEDPGGFGDLPGEDEGVAQSHLAQCVPDGCSVVLGPSGDGGVEGFLRPAQQGKQAATLTVNPAVVEPGGR
jgi:hypothetical protein